ncbi:MAG: DUF4038 domain-containing protein [Halanaerobiaceae bacterium]
MTKLSIKDNTYFVDEKGDPFFYLADTIWSSFTNTTLNEWEQYLDYRAEQGFNVLQINILRQWDASESDLELEPFKIKKNGKYDFSRPDEEYFTRAEKMLEMAVARDFIPALVVLWGNYVPGTWLAEMDENKRVMTLPEMKNYVEYAVDRFSKFNPVYLVSGDTGFQSDKADEYYLQAMKIIKEKTPEVLTTLHIKGASHNVSQKLIEAEEYDFYLYQSGHTRDYSQGAYKLVQAFQNKSVKRPILNGEPCYEGIKPHDEKGQGRFTALEVRKAIWQSLLSGAGAGVTYGAHGLWSWHKRGMSFGSKDVFDMPFIWSNALRLRGAEDATRARWIFEKYNLFGLEPVADIINKTEEIRMAETENCIVIYTPYNTGIKVNRNLSSYDLTVFELAPEKTGKPLVEQNDNQSIIQMGRFNTDRLIIGEK